MFQVLSWILGTWVYVWPLIDQGVSEVLHTGMTSGVLDIRVASGLPGFIVTSSRAMGICQSCGPRGMRIRGEVTVEETGKALRCWNNLFVHSVKAYL